MARDVSLELEHPTLINGFMDYERGPDYYGLAKYLINERGLKAIDNYIWIYDQTHYKMICEKMLSNIIMELTLDRAKPMTVSNYVRTAIGKAQIERDAFTTPEGFLNVANGIIDIKRRQLLPHTSVMNFKNVTPISFDPDAKCPEFLNFLTFVFDNDQERIDATAEIYGYCLMGGNPFLHKAFILYGQGRNGKSTWQHVLIQLLGKHNVSSVSMGLINKPFSAVRLDGKLANITGELPTSKLDSEAFKGAVGGETLSAANKGKDEYDLVIEARFVIACNEMPKWGDATTGMWEKVFMLPFNRLIRAEERDSAIYDRLDAELPGILNFALEGLQRVQKTRVIGEPQASQDLLVEYREESDSVFDFFSERIEISALHCHHRILLKDLYSNYAHFCRCEGVTRPVENRQFSKRLRRIIKERGGDNAGSLYEKGQQGKYFTGLFIRDFNNLQRLI